GIVTGQVELLLKGRCGAWEPYQRSSGEILYEDETDNVAAFSGGVCGVQHGDGVSAGGGYAASFAKEGAARSPSCGSAGGYLRQRGGAAPGECAGGPSRGRVRRNAASSS